MAFWTRNDIKNYRAMITYLSLPQPLSSSSQALAPSLDTILADVSREVEEESFHVHFTVCKINSPFPLIFHHSISITIHRVITLITPVKINTKRKRGKESCISFVSFVCLF